MASEQALIETIANSPIAMAITNPRRPDNPLEMVNAAFLSLTGYRESEILGKNCRFLAGDGTDETVQARISESIRTARPVLAELLNYRRDGSAFWNGLMVTPLFDGDGQLEWFLGSQIDLGEGKLQDRRSIAAERVAALPTRQREVLERLAKGLLNKQIAWDLGISEKTVKMHRALLLERLGVATSAEAIRLAVEAGL